MELILKRRYTMSHIMEREECRQVSLYIYIIYIAKHIQVDDHVYIYIHIILIVIIISGVWREV